MLTRTAEVKVTLTPQELAREFCEMDSFQQGVFFMEVGRIAAAEFGGHPGFESQMVYVANELRTAADGFDDTQPAERALRTMRTIGDAATL